MGKLISVDLPKDLPENWNDSHYVSPNGIEVGLTEKYGYNHLMRQVNASQQALLDLESIVCAGSTNLLDNSYFFNLVNRKKGFVVLTNTTYYTDADLTSDEGVLLEVTKANIVNGDVGGVDYEGEMYYVARSDMKPGFIADENGQFVFDRWWARECTLMNDVEYGNLTIKSHTGDPYRRSIVRQAVQNSYALAGKYVVFSVLVTGLPIGCSFKVYKSYTIQPYNDSLIVDQILNTGLNQVAFKVPSDVGKSAFRHLVCEISMKTGETLNVSAVKLQLGTVSNLAYYDEESNEWQLTDIPNPVVETLRCNGAPVSIGGIGMLLAPEDIGVHTANTMATAEIE